MEKSEDRAVADPLLKKLLELDRKINAECGGRPVLAGRIEGLDFGGEGVADSYDDVAENAEGNGSMSAGDDDV